jgi:capsular polysaccharide biosynthesis protein
MRPAAKIDGPLICAPLGTFYHWVLQVLPSVIHGLSSNPDARLLLAPRRPSYVDSSLEFLLGSDVNARVVESEGPVEATRLVMTQLDTVRGWVRPSDIKALREYNRATAPSGGGRRVYVSRLSAPKRRLANEGELVAAMKEAGVEVVRPEGMSFAEQVSLFSSASLIVGPHGAGLTNLIWSLSPGRLVEVFPHGFFNSCYARLAAMCNFEYRPVHSLEDTLSSGLVQVSAVLDACGLAS